MDAQSGPAQPRVIIVEDDKAVREMLSRVLRIGGFEVIVADFRSQALQALDELEVDALVLDIKERSPLGQAIIHRLQRDPKLGHIGWVVTSTMDQEDIRRLYGALEGHFLSKPFNPWELLERLKT